MANTLKKDISSHLSLATTYLYSHNFKKSLKEFKKAMKIDKTNRDAYLGVVGSLIELEKNKEAIEEINKILEYKPKDAFLYSLYGTALLNLGYLSEAVEKYKIASELDEKYWRKYNILKNAVDVIVNSNKE